MPAPTKCRPRLAQRRLAADGVGEVRVAAVDDDVAGLEVAAAATSITASVAAPALTIMMIRRGRFRLATNSSTVSAGHERALGAVRGHQVAGASAASGCTAATV